MELAGGLNGDEHVLWSDLLQDWPGALGGRWLHVPPDAPQGADVRREGLRGCLRGREGPLPVRHHEDDQGAEEQRAQEGEQQPAAAGGHGSAVEGH